MLKFAAAIALVATIARAQEEEASFNCIGNAPQLLGACGPELEYAGNTIPLNETAGATPEQLSALQEAWTENDLPTAMCCETIRQFVDATCICDPTLRGLLPGVGINVEPIESVLLAAGESCGTFAFSPCA